MRKNAAAVILLLLCLSGCGGKQKSPISEEQSACSSQSSDSGSVIEERETAEALIGKGPPLSEEADKLLNYVNWALNDAEYMPTAASVADTNGDHFPEIILEWIDGWNYQVYYYADGSVREAGDLTAWAWSSNLLKSPEGDLVLHTYPHTTGTAGLLQYRLYHWDGALYTLEADLCRTVAQWDYSDIYNPAPASFFYYLSDTCIDFNKADDEELARLCKQITQEEFEATIAGLGELTGLRRQTQEIRRLGPTEIEEGDRKKQTTQIMEFLRSELKAWQY